MLGLQVNVREFCLVWTFSFIVGRECKVGLSGLFLIVE